MDGLITGASRGLGLALTRALSERGWNLIVTARDAAALGAAVRGLPGVTPIAGDVADPAHRADLAAAIGRAGGLDLLVNNASALGPTPLPRLADVPPDVFGPLFEVNVVAPLALAQLALPTLRVRHGAIVNVTSDAAVEPYATWGVYGATKAALEQASNVLAEEEPDVSVWWVDPGEMNTAMLAEAVGAEDAAAAPDPADSVVPGLLRLLDERLPSGRFTAQVLASGARR
ncbi:SDR family NAD(P)-dependent oxidoreductase [Bailinhaonella thermotolerans]|uniref:SDR family oxidoreductase n=1 Tax=Bailinhaonella thermotolerans TaxID=1070861 RepID=A0A3A4A564_9ACTN|nr:SDR family oxidoreductase [Bailinhaonella thermotolerans]RJL20393.1 SDR family oxidoreductase [Bailinhaonella thermotolerans]